MTASKRVGQRCIGPSVRRRSLLDSQRECNSLETILVQKTGASRHLGCSALRAAAMDASLLLAIDGLREVAHTASEVIVANAGDDEKKDRSAFAVASDVEVGCLTVLGTKLDVPGDGSAPARRNIFDALSMLPGMMRPKDANGEAGPQPPDAPTLAAADAMKRAVNNARLAPVTDVIIVHNGDPVPTGFQRVAWSVTGMYPADLNAVSRWVAGAHCWHEVARACALAPLQSSGTRQLWIAVARFPTAPPITGLCVVMLELGEFIPPGELMPPSAQQQGQQGQQQPPGSGGRVLIAPLLLSCPAGFQPARRPATNKPANLRHGQEGAGEAYLCVSRAAGAPVIDVGLVFPHGAAIKPMANMMHLLQGGADARDAAGALPSLGQARATGFGGTAGQLEHAAQQSRPKLPFGLANLPLIGARPARRACTLLTAATLSLMPPPPPPAGPSKREELPVGYAALSHSLLRSSALLTGGSARGFAVLCYAKDLSHLDALSGAWPFPLCASYRPRSSARTLPLAHPCPWPFYHRRHVSGCIRCPAARHGGRPSGAPITGWRHRRAGPCLLRGRGRVGVQARYLDALLLVRRVARPPARGGAAARGSNAGAGSAAAAGGNGQVPCSCLLFRRRITGHAAVYTRGRRKCLNRGRTASCGCCWRGPLCRPDPSCARVVHLWHVFNRLREALRPGACAVGQGGGNTVWRACLRSCCCHCGASAGTCGCRSCARRLTRQHGREQRRQRRRGSDPRGSCKICHACRSRPCAHPFQHPAAASLTRQPGHTCGGARRCGAGSPARSRACRGTPRGCRARPLAVRL